MLTSWAVSWKDPRFGVSENFGAYILRLEDYEQNSLVSRNKIFPSPAAKALVDIRSKLLHFGQSAEEPEAWKGYLPTHGHDMFDIFGGKVATQEPEV